MLLRHGEITEALQHGLVNLNCPVGLPFLCEQSGLSDQRREEFGIRFENLIDVGPGRF
jgi:hypothetical protein